MSNKLYEENESKIAPKKDLPFTQEQYDLLGAEYYLIMQKKSTQSASQRAKIVAAFEKMHSIKDRANGQEKYAVKAKIV